MPHGQSLEFSGVTKRFGAVTAVAGLTARVEPGQVTGFLGPNGAGKTTTLRILLGLVRATDGHATIGGRRYAELDHPLQTVGAVLEASSFHPGRTAAAHLAIYAQAARIARARVDEVLDLVGLSDVAGRKVGGFSLGMRQRLGLAYALLGDPGVLVLDEPANGLDPEGIRWMRGFLRRLAAEGRTVLVSSHLLAEVQQTVDALLIISRGRLVFQGSIDELTDPDEHATVVDAPDRAALAAALQTAGVPFEVLRSGLTVRGLDPVAVGAAAAAGGVALSSLHRRGPALEEVFLDLVNGARVHASAAGGAGGLSQVPGTDAATLGLAAGTTSAGAAVSGAAVAGAAVAGTATPVVAADPEPSESEEPEERAVATASPEEEDAGSHEAEQSALSTAVLDAEGTSAPGAAAALGAAAGAAWASEARNDERGAATEGEPVTEHGGFAEAAEHSSAAEAAEIAAVDDLPLGAESAPTEPAPPWYAVASTGVIDIVPAAPQEQQGEVEPKQQGEVEPEHQGEVAQEQQGEAEQEHPGEVEQEHQGGVEQEHQGEAEQEHPGEVAPEHQGEVAQDQPGQDDAPVGGAETAADGASNPAAIHEEPAGPADDPWAPEDSNPDVEALGEIDDELSTPEPADADDDRPWEHYVKTDSDVEADAFFAAFDADGNPRPEPAPGAEPEPQPEPETDRTFEGDARGEEDTAPVVQPGAEPDLGRAYEREPGLESDEGVADPGGAADDAAPPPRDEPEPPSVAEPEAEFVAEAEPGAQGWVTEADAAPASEPEPEPEPAAPAPDAASVPASTDDEDADAVHSTDARHDEGGDR